jgi:E3 ubiquitin-protein ligase synoviolin
LIRELYETFRNFRIRIADYVRYRKITSNMNERFPDATTDELNVSDVTCIICREEMTSAKKLLCGHLFHVHCLRSWLERQHTCPTCRAPIIPPDNGHAAARPHGAQPGVQPGTVTPASEGTQDENMSRRQAKLQAAASAASIYGRSLAYPPSNTLNRRSGTTQPTSTSQSGEASSSKQCPQDQSQQFQNTSNPSAALPSIVPDVVGAETNTQDLEKSLQKAQENFIRSQIEMLQIQLQMVQRGAGMSATNNGNAEHTKND